MQRIRIGNLCCTSTNHFSSIVRPIYNALRLVMLLNLLRKTQNSIQLGQLWNRPSLTPGLWLWMHYNLLMRFARNRLSKLQFHLLITSHLKRRFSVMNYMILLSMRRKQTNYSMMLCNERGHHRIATKCHIPQTPILPFGYHSVTPTTETNLEGITTITEINNNRVREMIFGPASHP